MKKVVNPLTNRKVKVGGALHRKLCKDVRVNIAGCPEKKTKTPQKISKKEKEEIDDLNEFFDSMFGGDRRYQKSKKKNEKKMQELQQQLQQNAKAKAEEKKTIKIKIKKSKKSQKKEFKPLIMRKDKMNYDKIARKAIGYFIKIIKNFMKINPDLDKERYWGGNTYPPAGYHFIKKMLKNVDKERKTLKYIRSTYSRIKWVYFDLLEGRQHYLRDSNQLNTDDKCVESDPEDDITHRNKIKKECIKIPKLNGVIMNKEGCEKMGLLIPDEQKDFERFIPTTEGKGYMERKQVERLKAVEPIKPVEFIKPIKSIPTIKPIEPVAMTPAPKKKKSIKIKIKKIKKIKKVKEEVKEEEKKPILPMPSVQTLKQVLEDKKKLKQNKPVYYSSALTIQPFMLLHILEENKNDCTLGFKTYEKFESLSPYYISFTNSGKIKGVQQFRKTEIDKIIDKYKECAKNNKILLILVDLPSHSNIILINPVRKEIELFEPHGKISEDSTWFDRLETMGKSIKKEIVEKFNKKLKEKFTYVSTQSSCPAFQTFEGKFKTESRREGGIIIKDPFGWCTAWSYFYADLRFKFPEMSQDQLIREAMEILTEDPKELREFIRGQWMFIYDKAEELYKGGFITTYTRAKGEKREIYYKRFQEATKVWKKWLTEQFKKYSN